MKCSEIMQKEVVTCHETESASDCARVMREQNIGFVPVVNARGFVIGTITDRDLVVRGLAAGKDGATPIGDLMSRDIVACSPEDDVRSCERKMSDEKKSRMLVLQGGRCYGVISLSDIARVEDLARAGEVLRRVTQREERPVH
jgi:CBS domain-containing protein